MMPDASNDARTYLRIAGTPQAQPAQINNEAGRAFCGGAQPGGKEPGLRANFFAQAQPTAQPAKTALFAGGKEPGLRANFFALINK
jgi:hypothetical protein